MEIDRIMGFIDQAETLAESNTESSCCRYAVTSRSHKAPSPTGTNLNFSNTGNPTNMAVRRHLRKLRNDNKDKYPAPSPLVIFDRLNASGQAPPARTSHTANIHNGIMYVFGGQVGGQRVSRVDALDMSAAKWMNVSCGGETPRPRAGAYSRAGKIESSQICSCRSRMRLYWEFFDRARW